MIILRSSYEHLKIFLRWSQDLMYNNFIYARVHNVHHKIILQSWWYFCMIVEWLCYNDCKIILWWLQEYLTLYLRSLYHHHKLILQSSLDYFMILLDYCMIILRSYCDHLMIIHWTSCDHITGFLQSSCNQNTKRHSIVQTEYTCKIK